MPRTVQEGSSQYKTVQEGSSQYKTVQKWWIFISIFCIMRTCVFRKHGSTKYLHSSRKKLKRMVVWDWNQTWNENEVSWNVGLEWDWPAQNLRPLQGWSVVAPSSENAADSLFPYMASQHRGRGLHPHILQSDWGCLGGRMPSSSNSRQVVQRCHLH